MDTVVKLRVDYIYDPESNNWCFRVPSLGIIGGADTRDKAERAVIAAIRFTLEGDDDAPVTGGDVDYIQIALGGVA